MCISVQNENNLTVFFGPLLGGGSQKVETSHFLFQPLRARAVHGVSSLDLIRTFLLEENPDFLLPDSGFQILFFC